MKEFPKHRIVQLDDNLFECEYLCTLQNTRPEIEVEKYVGFWPFGKYVKAGLKPDPSIYEFWRECVDIDSGKKIIFSSKEQVLEYIKKKKNKYEKYPIFTEVDI